MSSQPRAPSLPAPQPPRNAKHPRVRAVAAVQAAANAAKDRDGGVDAVG